jgi:hypothetical protein
LRSNRAQLATHYDSVTKFLLARLGYSKETKSLQGEATRWREMAARAPF